MTPEMWSNVLIGGSLGFGLFLLLFLYLLRLSKKGILT